MKINEEFVHYIYLKKKKTGHIEHAKEYTAAGGLTRTSFIYLNLYVCVKYASDSANSLFVCKPPILGGSCFFVLALNIRRWHEISIN